MKSGQKKYLTKLIFFAQKIVHITVFRVKRIKAADLHRPVDKEHADTTRVEERCRFWSRYSLFKLTKSYTSKLSTVFFTLQNRPCFTALLKRIKPADLHRRPVHKEHADTTQVEERLPALESVHLCARDLSLSS